MCATCWLESNILWKQVFESCVWRAGFAVLSRFDAQGGSQQTLTDAVSVVFVVKMGVVVGTLKCLELEPLESASVSGGHARAAGATVVVSSLVNQRVGKPLLKHYSSYGTSTGKTIGRSVIHPPAAASLPVFVSVEYIELDRREETPTSL